MSSPKNAKNNKVSDSIIELSNNSMLDKALKSLPSGILQLKKEGNIIQAYVVNEKIEI